MASGFSGGNPGFYTGRSVGTNAMSNGNQSQSQSQSHPSYRSQIPGIFSDQISQIATRTAVPNFIGKRTLADYQMLQQYGQNPVMNGGGNLRTVKPRIFHQTSPMSQLSPMDLFQSNLSSRELPSFGSTSSSAVSQRYGRPVFQQLRPQPMISSTSMGTGTGSLISQSNNSTLPGISYMNTVHNRVQQAQDPEKKMMSRLQELEKELLDDDNVEEGDTVSVVTNMNSEWSETIQNLIGLSSSPSGNTNPISPSPISSPSSSSASSSVVSPAVVCSKQTIMEVASAIAEGKTDSAGDILARISQSSNPKANSEQKLLDYLLSALKSRFNPADNPPLVAELYGKDHVTSTQFLYELSPCFKLGFMAANQAILEATLEKRNCNGFHVIDFEVGQGGQYVNLLHALSTRQNGVHTVVKITAVTDNVDGADQKLKVVGDMLSQLADRVGVSLKFNVVTGLRLSDLSRESLGCDPDEPLAVNFAFKLYRIPDESVSIDNPRDELLRRVKALSPVVVTLVEQEMNANTAPFLARVGETSSYYGALLDSIESTVPRDNPDRVKVEEGIGRKLGNSVACEGRERVERCEMFGKWRARMCMAGLELKPLSQTIAESMRSRLSSGSRIHPSFTVKEENGGVCFGWMGRTLTVASAWR